MRRPSDYINAPRPMRPIYIKKPCKDESIHLVTCILAVVVSTTLGVFGGWQLNELGHTITGFTQSRAEAEAMQAPSFEYSEEADLQLPELPTGCEATAASTLLRMNGIQASKIEVADAMPKSDGDFVNAYWGDPYSEAGWAIMSPGMTATLIRFMDSGHSVRNLTKTALPYVELPAMAWVTMDCAEPYVQAQQDGFYLMVNTHCVVVTEVGDETVKCIDPLKGPTEYPRKKFESVYDSCGMQAIHISEVKSA